MPLLGVGKIGGCGSPVGPGAGPVSQLTEKDGGLREMMLLVYGGTSVALVLVFGGTSVDLELVFGGTTEDLELVLGGSFVLVLFLVGFGGWGHHG
jgi:hypothetical protein